jgi:outer membrane protein assembly factor BamB
MLSCRRSLCVLGMVVLVFGLAHSAETPPASSWVHWRGPGMQGHCDDNKVPLVWSEKQNLLWKTKLPGPGNSTPIIWGDRVFLTSSSSDGKSRQVVCINAIDGKVLWQQTASEGVPPGKTHNWNGYASASCTTDGARVYAFFGTPGLFCYDFEGKELWKHDFGVFTSEAGWGTAASPFLFEDLVIQNCDNDGARAMPGGKAGEAAPMALVALNKTTGKVVWSTPRNMGRGFSTPCLIPTVSGRIDLVLNGPLAVCGYDPRTGKELWRCERFDNKDQQKFGEPLPVFNAEAMFIASGRPGPCQAIRMPDSGNVTKTNVLWEEVRKGHRDVASPILVDGLVYATDMKGSLSCYDFKTGKELYTERLGNGTNKPLASPILVRGQLLWLLDDGTTIVQEPGPKFKVVGRNKLGDGNALDFGASPAVAAGKLYLRSQTHLYCIGEAK